jgi:hypothetical protein
MKKRTSTIRRPHRENKSGEAMTPSERVHSSTNKTREEDVNTPQGVESDYKDALLESKRKRNMALYQEPKTIKKSFPSRNK